MAVTGAQSGVTETRFGLRHRLQFGDRLECGGWSNRGRLGVVERSRSRAAESPLLSANNSQLKPHRRVDPRAAGVATVCHRGGLFAGFQLAKPLRQVDR